MIPALRNDPGTIRQSPAVPADLAAITLVPEAIARHGDRSARAWIEFFTARIRNRNTRMAYARACAALFHWLGERGIDDVRQVTALHVAAWVEWRLGDGVSRPTVKLELAAVRQLFSWLAQHQVIPASPAETVRGPRHVVRTGQTPILSTAEARRFLRWLPARTITELRDRALIATLAYAFARISAAVALDVRDVHVRDSRWHLRLSEKGGKIIDVPCHHNLEAWLREYMEAGGLQQQPYAPLFRAVDRRGSEVRLSERRLNRRRALEAVSRRAEQAHKAGVIGTWALCAHSFRAIGITAYLEHPDARVEVAQYLAGHAKTETTRLYDRRAETISLDEIERIGL